MSRLLLAGAIVLVPLTAGCATTPETASPAPELDLTPVSVVDEARIETLERFRLAMEAAGEGNPDAAYERLLQVVDRCGTAPLGQQALLMLAIGELDPRNPDPRLHLAVEASSRLARWTVDTTWIHRVADALYLISRRLAPRPSHLDAQDVEALRERVGRATDGRVRLPSPDCSAGWPGAGGADGSLPDLDGVPYPVQVTRLRHELRQLRREVERLRRLARHADASPVRTAESPP